MLDPSHDQSHARRGVLAGGTDHRSSGQAGLNSGSMMLDAAHNRFQRVEASSANLGGQEISSESILRYQRVQTVIMYLQK